MAITFSKEPLGIYPAYNDSWIEFSSDLVDDNKAEITVYPIPTFLTPFIIYPDSSGNYLFNLKEIVKAQLNENGFEDQFTILPTGFSQSTLGNYRSQSIDIEVFNNNDSEGVSKSYTFYKAVKQIGEPIHNNNCQILNHSKNGVDYTLNYWEGFPFFFELQRVNVNKDITIKNLNTGDTSDPLTATSTNSLRIYIDKVTENWTTEMFLPLPDVHNRLEIYEEGLFKTNLLLKKHTKSCGVYLKWFNSDGSYSFWLFDEFYRDTLRTSQLSEINNNVFNNVDDGLKSSTLSTGKKSDRIKRLKTRVKDYADIKTIESLFNSPHVQMYSSFEAYTEGEFINVQLSGDFNISNKRNINEVTVTIQLPEQKTITY